jgi:K+ transporter
MSIDNDGEGGILALMSLLGIKKHQRPGIIAVGLFGAALIYGDGAITPAISVLSALEGLNIATPALKSYILPAAVAILVAVFAIQPLGTSRIGKAFGPIMGLWFLSSAVLGLWGIMRHPAVLAALNPLYGLRYLLLNGYASFVVLGGVFLCVTGAEALYADMGHFGRRPIRLAWSGIVFPSLILNSALLFIAMREVWGWGLLASGAIAGAFLFVDASFFLANLVKVADGGYVPLLLASIVYGVMLIWHRGSTVVAQRLTERLIPVSEFMDSIKSQLKSQQIPRVPGTAVFLTWTLSGTPPVMVWHLKHNRALHDHLFALRAEPIPWIKDSERLAVIEVAPQFLAGDGAPWIPGEARHSCPLETGARERVLPRVRRRHLLCRPRNDRSPGGRKGSGQMGGGALRRDGTQRRACHRLLQASERRRRRTRPARRDLTVRCRAAAAPRLLVARAKQIN